MVMDGGFLLDLLQLEYFKTVARLEHMSNAARKLNISQPALSKTIINLENELGVELFNREGRNIRLNSNGQKFLARVNNVFNEINEGIREIHDVTDTIESSVAIAALMPNLLANILSQFLKIYPNTRISQFSSFHGRMLKQLENYEVDFCFTLSPIEGENLEWHPVRNSRLYATLSIDHPLASRTSIGLEELADEVFIDLNSNFNFRRSIDNFCLQAGFTRNTQIELENTSAIIGLISKNHGITITVKLSPDYVNFKKIVQIPISNDYCKLNIGLLWNNKHYLSKAALNFKDFAIGYFQELDSNFD